MRQSDRTAIAFIIICIVSGSLVYVFLRDSDTTDNRRPSAAFTREKNGGAYYAQPDVGYGNGNMAVNYGLKAELFPFDPNTADSTTLLRLGLKPWQVRNIYKYRAHGGRYRRREDFARLYGLTLSQYRRLEPYIHIEKDVMAADVIGKGTAITPAGYEDAYPSSTSLGQMTSGRRAAEHDNTCPSHSVRPAKLTLDDDKVDINTADTTLLKRIPGIGSILCPPHCRVAAAQENLSFGRGIARYPQFSRDGSCLYDGVAGFSGNQHQYHDAEGTPCPSVA